MRSLDVWVYVCECMCVGVGGCVVEGRLDEMFGCVGVYVWVRLCVWLEGDSTSALDVWV